MLCLEPAQTACAPLATNVNARGQTPSAAQIEALWPQWRAEDARFVYATNAIEGSPLTLGETIVVLQEGVTVRGKPLRDRSDAVNGQRAFSLMLDLAQRRIESTLEVLLDIHARTLDS